MQVRGLVRGDKCSLVLNIFFQETKGRQGLYGVSEPCGKTHYVSGFICEVLLASASNRFAWKSSIQGVLLPKTRKGENWICKLMEQLLHSPKAACQILGISRSTLYRLINEGQIEVTRIRSLPRFTEASLKRFVERQVVQSREQAVSF